MAHFKKGVEVHLRDYNGMVIYDSRYRIRSCGKKQATLEHVRAGSGYHSTRGQNYYITPEAEVRDQYGNNPPNWLKTAWSQHFVLAGIDGWDPQEN